MLARKMWRTLEPFHGLVYFTPHATAAYAALGVTGQAGYFASRAAPMGPVPAGVVVATFYNFNPAVGARRHPRRLAGGVTGGPGRGRPAAIDRALREVLGRRRRSRRPTWSRPPTSPAAPPMRARPRAGPSTPPTRRSAWPEAPHLGLWHAVTLLREFRGDGHVAALVGRGSRRLRGAGHACGRRRRRRCRPRCCGARAGGTRRPGLRPRPSDCAPAACSTTPACSPPTARRARAGREGDRRASDGAVAPPGRGRRRPPAHARPPVQQGHRGRRPPRRPSGQLTQPSRCERLRPGAVGGPPVDGVLVEALGQVQALEHELDGAGDRRPGSRRRRPGAATGSRSAGHVLDEAGVGRPRSRPRPCATTAPSSKPSTTSRRPPGSTVGLEHGEHGGPQQVLDDLLVAAVVERLDLDLAHGRRGEGVEVADPGARRRARRGAAPGGWRWPPASRGWTR